jgi:hypothetical protein
MLKIKLMGGGAVLPRPAPLPTTMEVAQRNAVRDHTRRGHKVWCKPSRGLVCWYYGTLGTPVLCIHLHLAHSISSASSPPTCTKDVSCCPSTVSAIRAGSGCSPCTSGLRRRLPGSSGTPSRPPSTKRLTVPPRNRSAHRSRRSSAAWAKACGRGATAPLSAPFQK